MCNLRMESHGYSNSCSSLEFDSFDHHIFCGMNRLIIGQHLLHEGLKPQDHLNQVHLMGFWSGFKSPLSTQLEDQIACGKEVKCLANGSEEVNTLAMFILGCSIFGVQ